MATERAEASRELVEREAELARLQALLTAAADGRGGAVVVEGPAGIGKTSLIDAAGRLAADAGIARLSARGGELERDFAYGVVRQLLEPRLLRAEARERDALLQGAAGLAAPLLGVPGTSAERYMGALGDDPTAAALHGLYWLTANLAAEMPLLVAVDDLHWCDTASLRFLAYLARRVDELPVLLLAASRPPVEAHAPELLEALATDPLVRRLAPAPLTRDAVAELVRGERGAADPAFCRACHEATGGNPFLVRAMLDGVDARTVGRSVERRLAALGPDALSLARAVAVLGTNADQHRATMLAGLDDAAGAAATDALVAAQVLGTGRPLEFVHPIVRSAVYDAIPPAERAASHRAAAQLLTTHGVDPEQVAPHLLAAEPRGDAEVVALLRDAAVRSIDRGAPEAAVRYLRRALEEPPDELARPEVLADLGKAEVRAALPDEAVEHLRDALAATPDPRRRAQMTHDLAIGLIAPGRYVEAVAMLEEAVEAAASVDLELARRVEAELICGARLVAETLPITRQHLDALPDDIAGDTPGERMLLATLAHQRVIDGQPPSESMPPAFRAIDGGLLDEQPGDSGLVVDVVFALFTAGEFERAEHAIETALADVRRRGSVIGFARQTCMRAMLQLQRGALAEAESDARATIDAAWEPGYRIARMAYAPLVEALVEQGRVDEARRALETAGLDGELPDAFMLNFVLFARARLRMADGRETEAGDDLELVGERERKWRGNNPAIFPWRSLLALLRRDMALADEELVLAHRVESRGAVGRALRVRGLITGGDDGIGDLRESVDVLAGSPWRIEHARTLVDLGAAIRRAGRRSEAREPLHAGMELAHACGATPLVERAREELVATGARPRRIMRTGVDALTPSEKRVARMAAEGMTNREIAQALFVTTRTVEVHLTHAYQKLDIASRDELASALA